MTEIRICAERAQTEPKYKASAAALLMSCREFYQKPENEEAYQEWKRQRRGGGSECCGLSAG